MDLLIVLGVWLLNMGGFYLTTKDDKEEFNYEVRFIDNKFIINVEGFEGSPEELLEISE